MTGVLVRGERHTWGEESHVKPQTPTRMPCDNAGDAGDKESDDIAWQGTRGPGDRPGAGRGKEGPSPAVSWGARPCPHLDFGLPASRTVREYISAVLIHLVSSTLLWRP